MDVIPNLDEPIESKKLAMCGIQSREWPCARAPAGWGPASEAWGRVPCGGSDSALSRHHTRTRTRTWSRAGKAFGCGRTTPASHLRAPAILPALDKTIASFKEALANKTLGISLNCLSYPNYYM